MTSYFALRPVETRSRSYAAGDTVNDTTVPAGEMAELLATGAFVPTSTFAALVAADSTVASLVAADATLPSTYAAKAATWADATAYVVGELVLSGGTLYRCTTAHTSSGSLDSAKFSSVGSGGDWVFRVSDYGAVGDCQDAYTGAITSSSTTLTISAGDSGGAFASGDVGATIWVAGAGAAGADLLTTIASYTSTTEVELTDAASTTVSSGGSVVWGTDDTAAIRSAIDAAAAWALAGPYAATVQFDAACYLLASSTLANATTLGNSQLPLPYVDPATDRKVVLTLQGASDGTNMVHWAQVRPQVAGTVLRSVLSGLSTDGTYGPPSVIGSPTTKAGFANGYSNMLAVIDGITVMVPPNPSIQGVDLYACANASVKSLACLAGAAVPAATTTPRLNVTPTNDLGIGLRLPSLGNNDNVTIGSYSCEGFYYGLACADHTTAQRVALIYCDTGIYIYGSGALDHGVSILNLSVEAVTTAVQSGVSGGGQLPLHIPRCDMEGVTNVVVDSNNGFHGELHYQSNNGSQLTATGATSLRLINDARARGATTPPSVPATTVALQNPFQRDALVIITGGTVTVIDVDGQTTGITAGTVLVPTQKSITLTYSSAPTWTWTLL